jgi:hypothetical protein
MLSFLAGVNRIPEMRIGDSMAVTFRNNYEGYIIRRHSVEVRRGYEFPYELRSARVLGEEGFRLINELGLTPACYDECGNLKHDWRDFFHITGIAECVMPIPVNAVVIDYAKYKPRDVTSLPENVQTLLNANTDDELMKVINVGVELEFSEADGLLHCDEDEEEHSTEDTLRRMFHYFDSDLTMIKVVSYWLNNAIYREFTHSIDGYDPTISSLNDPCGHDVQHFIRKAYYWLRSQGIGSDMPLTVRIQDMSPSQWNMAIRLLEEVFNRYTNFQDAEECINTLAEDYGLWPKHDNEWKAIDGWCNHPDGTSGIEQEYTTKGGQTIREMNERLNVLFNELDSADWDCPVNGSCHVHVQLPYCRHKIQARSLLGQCIIYELSECLADEKLISSGLRQRLVERWEDDSATQYFHNVLGFDDHKYSVIHSHSQGTLEFRLFGHVGSKAHVKACVHIAALATIRGFRRFHEGRTEFLGLPEFDRYHNFGDDFWKSAIDGEFMSDRCEELNPPTLADVMGIDSYRYVPESELVSA